MFIVLINQTIPPIQQKKTKARDLVMTLLNLTQNSVPELDSANANESLSEQNQSNNINSINPLDIDLVRDLRLRIGRKVIKS